ncbi:MAG: hypothetical protein H6732_16080 [Alphaproteobacteria bacterium]|nr:hypothetical protein [Alphaproteobacteria bacterium]
MTAPARPLAPLLVALSAAAGGCAPSDPAGVRLLVPADVEFSWKTAYNDEGDGLAAILPVDVMVYEGVSGVPVGGSWVELWSEGATLVPTDRVEPGDMWCARCLWDAYRDEFVELPDDGAPAGRTTEVAPLLVETDAAGLARVYAVVDAVGVGAEGFEPVRVHVALEEQPVAARAEGFEHTLLLVPR